MRIPDCLIEGSKGHDQCKYTQLKNTIINVDACARVCVCVCVRARANTHAYFSLLWLEGLESLGYSCTVVSTECRVSLCWALSLILSVFQLFTSSVLTGSENHIRRC